MTRNIFLQSEMQNIKNWIFGEFLNIKISAIFHFLEFYFLFLCGYVPNVISIESTSHKGTPLTSGELRKEMLGCEGRANEAP